MDKDFRIIDKRLCNFNPTLVQLESETLADNILMNINFNPTLVQLELVSLIGT